MYTYLALGDSYTIGEQVPLKESFPYQTVDLLRKQHMEIADPVIIATTGWTTDELAASIREHNLREHFSFVTLLIGVNNQYRHRNLENYKEEFAQLLDQSIGFASGNPQHVFVVSIPDWSVTPFAEGKDRAQTGKEIDDYNAANKHITLDHKCQYTYITDSMRTHAHDNTYVAGDGLHPSAKEYGVWAGRLAPMIGKTITG